MQSAVIPMTMSDLQRLLKESIWRKDDISKELTNTWFVDGLHPITSIGNKMKNCLMELQDKILLR